MTDPPERAARALADGDIAEVRRAFEAAVPSGDADRARWALLLLEAGELDLARLVTQAISDGARRDALASALELERVTPRTEQDDEEESLDMIEVQPVRLVAEDTAVVRAFVRFFAGRRDLYAAQWYDARRARGGYRPVREPFTEAVARAHLSGRCTVGQYLLWPDDTVSFGVVDLDLSASARAALSAGHGEGTALRHGALRMYATRLLESARRLCVPFFAEDSGNRGVHLWMFLEPRRAAKAARALLARIVETAGSPPPDVSVELFPKQERPGKRGLSSLVKLPLGIHRTTMRSCPLLDDSLEPIDDIGRALSRLRPIEPATADAILGQRLIALPASAALAEVAPPLPRERSPRSLAEALRRIPDGVAARQAAERMIDGCAVLRWITNRAFGPERLSADQARALIYSVGLVGKTPELAVEILAAAQVPMRELHRVRGGLPSPVGCRRLRALGVAECSACPSRGTAEPYSTPAVFAVGSVAAAPPRHTRFAAWLEPAGDLEPDALEQLSSRIELVDERLRRLEASTGVAAPDPGIDKDP